MTKLRDLLVLASSWHILVLVAIFYIARQAFFVIPPRLEEHRQAKYHWVNAGLFCTVSQLLLMFALDVRHRGISTFLKLTTFLSWTITVAFILFNSEPSPPARHGAGFTALTRRLSIIFILAAPVIVIFYDGGATGFFDDIDRFAVVVQEGGNQKQVSPRPVDALTPSTNSSSSPPNSSNLKVDASDSPKELSSKEPAPRWKLSHVPKGIFFFLQAFLVTSYYGTMLHYRYKDKNKAKSESIGAMDQVVFVLSLAFSIWIVFLLLGFDTLSISIFSGLVAIGVSVALRDLLSNYVAGMMLLWDKSVKMNDVIAIGNSRVGRVKDITMRYMVVEDRSDVEFLVPHSQLINSTFENWTRRNRKVRLKLDIGVAYDAPIEKVKDIMRAVCFEVPRVLKHPLPNPLILSIDESAIHFQLRFRIADPEEGIRNVISDVYERLIKRFDEEHIEMPYPQREFRLRKPERVDPTIDLASS
jgi:small-conductance mechanosensitive channel